MAEPDTRVERIALDTLTPHPRNVREGDVGAIIESLRAFGQYRPIVVQRATPDGEDRMVILAGNQTAKAAIEFGMTDIDAVLLDVDDDTGLRIMLADNRVHDRGRDEAEPLLALLSELGETSLVGTGWELDDLDDIMRRLGTYDPAVSILGAFEGVGGTDSEETAKTFLHGRDAEGNDLYVLRLSLTADQRSDVLRAFARAKGMGVPTQQEAIALIARHYMEGPSA